MELQGARAGSGGGFPGWRVVGCELRGARIEVEDVDLVEAEVVDEQETVVGRDGDAVRVRGFLALMVGSVTGKLLERDRWAEVAIIADEKRCSAAAAVVCGKDRTASVVDRDMAGAVAISGDLIDLGELCLFFVEGVAGDGASVFAFGSIEFIGDEDDVSLGTESEKSGIVRFSGEADLLQITGGGVEGVGVDAFAGFSGLGADQQ